MSHPRRTCNAKRKLRRFKEFALAVHPFCQWCNLPLTYELATADHIVPESRGGSHSWANLVLACWECNQRRGDNFDPAEWFEGPSWSDDQDVAAADERVALYRRLSDPRTGEEFEPRMEQG